MKFPAMNKQSKRRIGIPALTGGLNLRDNPTQCNDNQLTELVNMWYKDGSLRTRPGVHLFDEVKTVGYDETVIPHQTDIFMGEYRLFYFNIWGARNSETVEGTTETFGETGFWLQGEEKIIELPILKNSGVKFVCRHNNFIYAFIGNENQIWKLEFSFGNEDPKVVGDWAEVEEKEYHTPLVAMNCKCDGSLSMSTEEVMASGTAIEGFNILSSYYKLSYNAYNPEVDTITDDDGNKIGHKMIYGLLDNTVQSKYIGMTVSAEYTSSDGKTYSHSVTITGDATVKEKASPGDGLIMEVFCQVVRFYNEGTTTFATITEDNKRDNNLIFKAPYISDNSEKNKIFNMTRCVWFGGASAGLAGGTRLFLCGNSYENEKSLVCWSGLNNPLYFPENSYFYVGDTSEAVTGFGKQSDMLVIFKKNETWYTQYQQNGNITAESLINQSVVDIQSSAVYFPLIQINPSIGCPYPDTVQLCRNRLVWLGSGGRVYTLTNQNQYSERNIYCVSDMISRRLRAESELKNAFSADWEGHYLLFVRNKVYVMDYESYGYVYVASHTKIEDAQIKIPWWYWTIGDGEYNDETARSVIVLNNRLYIVFYRDEPNGLLSGFGIKQISPDFTDDDGEPIHSAVQTKLFNFGEPNSYKNISSVGLSLGYNGGDEITVTFITDGGEEQTGLVLEDEAEERSAGFAKSRILCPAICSAVRFGLRLQCEGNMIIDGLTLDYRVTGRAR